jgi:hypothetical protein
LNEPAAVDGDAEMARGGADVLIARPAGPDFRAWQAGIATKGLVKSVLRAIVGKTGRTKNFDQTGRISRRQQ